MRNWCKVRPENYQLTTETGRSKWKVKSFPKNLGKRIRDILLTFSNTETDSERGEDKTEDRDDDGEDGSEAEAVEDPGQASPGLGGAAPGVQSGEVVELGGGPRVIVCSHLQVLTVSSWTSANTSLALRS